MSVSVSVCVCLDRGGRPKTMLCRGDFSPVSLPSPAHPSCCIVLVLSVLTLSFPCSLSVLSVLTLSSSPCSLAHFLLFTLLSCQHSLVHARRRAASAAPSPSDQPRVCIRESPPPAARRLAKLLLQRPASRTYTDSLPSTDLDLCWSEAQRCTHMPYPGTAMQHLSHL